MSEEKTAKQEKLTTYWKVTHGADLTEGCSYRQTTYISCYGLDSMAELWVHDWCYRTLGRPLTFAQNMTPTRRWGVHKITRTEFKAKPDSRMEGYTYLAQTLFLKPGPKNSGLVAAGSADGVDPDKKPKEEQK